MADLTPAQELRAAAKLMHERAELASDAQRKKAHDIHKEHMRCADGSARAEAVLDGATYPCTGNHDDGLHHFRADRPDPCPAPFCKLPFSHFTEGSMHDIPSGRPEYRIKEAPRDLAAELRDRLAELIEEQHDAEVDWRKKNITSKYSDEDPRPR